MEPIQRVVGPSGKLDGIAAAHRLVPVTREEGDRDRERDQRRRPRQRRAVEQGDDGRPHVDVQA